MTRELKTIEAADRASWRDWLERHHAAEREVWLVFHKKHTDKACVSYEEAVEEALCFGWIDSIVRRLDDERYAQKFTPRRADSRWSELNKWRVARMAWEGRMSEAGLATVTFRLGGAPRSRPRRERTEFIIPAEFAAALDENAKARANFDELPPFQRRNMVAWATSAKKAETRARRLTEALGLLERGEKLGMK